MDPDWSCPVCRGICNCSICRTKAGKVATGQLFHQAQSRGFASAKEYLDSLKTEKEEEADE